MWGFELLLLLVFVIALRDTHLLLFSNLACVTQKLIAITVKVQKMGFSTIMTIIIELSVVLPQWGPILFYFTEVALHSWFHEIYFLDLQFGSIKSVAFEIDGIWNCRCNFIKEFSPIVSWLATLLCYCYWPVQVSIGWDWAEKMGGQGSSGLGWLGQGSRVGWTSRDLRVVGRWAKQHLRLEICF